MAAFERLVVETSPQVYALAFRLVGNEQDARDVVQETYLRAFTSIARFRGEAAIGTWLYRICANCASSYLRRGANRRHARLAEDDESLVEARHERDPEAMASATEARAELTTLLAGLPANLRAVVVLHDIYDLSHEAIAAELGISRAAARVRLHRARARLRDALYPPAGHLEAGGLAPTRGAPVGGASLVALEPPLPRARPAMRRTARTR